LAGAFVLATGRFVSGGIAWEAKCRETLFGLPVASDQGLLEVDGPDAAVRETPMESHPLMTAGVQVGSALQPLADGRVAFDNLYAAGMVVGGFASRYVMCADGVAMSTGFLAGEAAVYKASVSA
jgi:anaerobic glycerol-3-phosphate dehydrogenase